MANTTFTQDTLDKIEATIAQAFENPKEGVKLQINHENGGSVTYRSLKELFDARKELLESLNTDTNIDFGAVKASAYRPFTPTLGCQSGNS